MDDGMSEHRYKAQGQCKAQGSQREHLHFSVWYSSSHSSPPSFSLWLGFILGKTLSLTVEFSFLFVPFSLVPLSFSYTLSDSNQTSNYSSALRLGLWGCMCVWMCVLALLFSSENTHKHTHDRTSDPCWCLLLHRLGCLTVRQPMSYLRMKDLTDIHTDILQTHKYTLYTVQSKSETTWKMCAICTQTWK